MDFQTLDLTILSAKDLKKWTKKGVYVTVSISGYPFSTQTTPHSNDGGSHHRWGHNMRFTINESAAKESDLFLMFNIRRARYIKDKDIGGVRVSIKELLAYDTSAGGRVVAYSIRGLLGKVRGEIEFRYKFFRDVSMDNGPAVPYLGMGPAGPYPVHGRGYPPYGSPGAHAPAPYVYGYPPPAQHYGGPYAYAPQPQHGPSTSYGVHHQQQQLQPPKKKQHKGSKIKSKLGIGLGIAGGLIGGLLFGEDVSEAISDFVGAGADDVADLVGAGVADVAAVVGGGGVADLVGGGAADVANVVEGGVADMADEVGAGVTDVGGEVADVADVVGGEVADVAAVEGGVADVADEVGAGVNDVVGGGVADVADTVGGQVADVAQSVGDTADVADTVGGQVADVAQSVGDTADVAGNLTEAATDAGISAAANVAQPLL